MEVPSTSKGGADERKGEEEDHIDAHEKAARSGVVSSTRAESHGRSSQAYRQRSTVVIERMQQQEQENRRRKWYFTPFQTMIYWFTLPYNVVGHILSVDLTGRYREHFVWACDDGDKLIRSVTSRFQSTSVFLSLLVSTTLMVFFNSSQPVQDVRDALIREEYDLEFFTGIAMCISTIASLGALLANFTAWSILVVVSKENAAIILRSSLGLYAEQLPNRLVVLAIYLFLVWVVMFWYILIPSLGAALLTVAGIVVVGHIASTYSAIGQIIMASSAMSSQRILPAEEEEKMSPQELYHVLLHDTILAKKANVPISQQYRMNYHQFIREFDSFHMDSDLGRSEAQSN